MTSMIGSILLSGLLLQTSPATAPATQDGTVVAAIERLSDPDPAIRDAAQEELFNADPSVIEQLKAARDATSDPDLQLRLDSLIVRYSEGEAIGSTRITLKFDNAPLKDVLAELGRQSKAVFADPVHDFGNEPPRVTIDVRNVSFWQALVALRQTGNLAIMPQGDTWRVMRNGGNGMFGSNAVEAGAFLVQPQMASYTRSISYGPNMNSGENFSITFQMIGEPKIRLSQSAGQFRLTKAVDSNGNDLAGPNMMQTFGIGQNMFHISAQLVYPKNPGERIAELSGTVKLNIARQVESFSIENFGPASKPLERQLEGTKITITPGEPVAGQPNWVPVTVVVEPQGDPTMINRLQAPLRQLRIMDAAGQALQMNQFQANSPNGQRSEYRLSFMPMGNAANTGPYKLLFEFPTSYREIEVPISVRNLKMP